MSGSSTSHAEMDRRNPLDVMEYELGTWDGRRTLLCEREWRLREELGSVLPVGRVHETEVVQAARKEYHYNKLSPELKAKYDDAAVNGWKAYTDNQAIEVLSREESLAIRRDLAKRGELDRILRPMFVLTDKHDGLRTPSNDLPVKASAR